MRKMNTKHEIKEMAEVKKAKNGKISAKKAINDIGKMHKGMSKSKKGC